MWGEGAGKVPQSRRAYAHRGSFPGMFLSQGRVPELLMKPKAKELPPGFLGLKT